MPFSIQLIICLFLVAGCATSKPAKISSPVVNVKPPTAPAKSAEETSAQNAEQKGIVFGSTEFLGVLKASYARIHFTGQRENTHQFDLDIRYQSTAYFFLELPAGVYKITSISIPVGSTTAVEPADIEMMVSANKVTYIGALTFNGTKERIKLGGVPVIRPGFEYTVQLNNAYDAAVKAFYVKYPNDKKEIQTQLMVLNQNANKKTSSMPIPLQKPNEKPSSF